MATICKNASPLIFGNSDPSTFQTCNFLVNVLSNMYEQWAAAAKPKNFHWGKGLKYQPTDVCPITMSNFKVSDFNFGTLIWSTDFVYNKKGDTASEPFGCVVESNKDGALYLVFRGSKSLLIDFAADALTDPTAYSAPTPHAPSNIQIETGWSNVYNGLRSPLCSQLQTIRGKGQKLTVTGHSLGSTLATLAVPDAVNSNMQVRNYNSASPMVGLKSFLDYYNSLTVIGGAPGLLTDTYRLINSADTVPSVPNSIQHQPPQYQYVPVGNAVSFNADYGAEKKNHHPCCCYGYALWNPTSPCNPVYDSCAGKSSE